MELKAHFNCHLNFGCYKHWWHAIFGYQMTLLFAVTDRFKIVQTVGNLTTLLLTYFKKYFCKAFYSEEANLQMSVMIQWENISEDLQEMSSQGTKKRRDMEQIMTKQTPIHYQLTNEEELQQRKCLGAVRRGGGTLNQFYSCKTSLIVLMHLPITNLFGPHSGFLPHLVNITVKHI